MLKGQCIRSGAGLYYESYEEFAEALYALESNGPLHARLGRNGREYFCRNYTWPVIERKYLDLLRRLQGGDAAAPDRAAARLAGPPPPRPAGCRRGARRSSRRAPPATRAPRVPGRHDGAPAGAPRVHQVLATLGYGDAIGHEVLGIQRVLRGAGYTSEIFVETADPRLEPLTLDYRDMIGNGQPTTTS